MFLSQLKESNKEDFLKVCVFASLCNEVFADKEKEMLYAYCREMNIKEHIPEISEKFEELLEKICNKTNEKEKNIYILEILALVKADGHYDNQEQEFMKHLVEGFGLTLDVLNTYEELLNKYSLIEKEMWVMITK